MRILVVEDDKDVAGFVLKGLREAGHTVEHADNGRDSLLLAASENFDTIILDRMLPGASTGSAARDAAGQDNETPVLFLPRSARSTTGWRAEGRRRRLSGQALRLRRAAGPGRGPGPARRDRRCSHQLRVGDLEMDLIAQGARGGQDIDLQPRDSAAGISDAPRRPGGDPHHAAGKRLGIPFRPADQRHRRPCLAPAPKIDKRFDRPLLHTVRNAGYMLRAEEV